jgi:hypothetical protein
MFGLPKTLGYDWSLGETSELRPIEISRNSLVSLILYQSAVSVSIISHEWFFVNDFSHLSNVGKKASQQPFSKLSY